MNYYKYIFILIILLIGGCTHWHVERYIVEGAGYLHEGGGHTKETKKYFISGEEIKIGTYPQTISRKPNKRSGPYKVGFSLGRATNVKKKTIILHDIKITSSLGKTYRIEDAAFPIKPTPKPCYRHVNYPEEFETCFHYSMHNELTFAFSKNEIIFISLDIEVINGSKKTREAKTLKLIPILDAGSRIVVPGEGV